MSSRKHLFRIQDMLKAIEKIEGYLGEMTWTEFKANELVIDGVVRNFEILGEASGSIPSSIRRAHPDIPWKPMHGMRNILIHEYFGVDLKTVWHTARERLPELRERLEILAEKLARTERE